MKTPKLKLLIMIGVALLIANGSKADNPPPPCVCDCAPYEGSGDYVRQDAVFTETYNSPTDTNNFDGIANWGTNYIRIATRTDIGVSETLNYTAGIMVADDLYHYFDAQGMVEDVYSRSWIWSGPPWSDPGATGNFSVSGSLNMNVWAGNSNATPSTLVQSWALTENDIGVWQDTFRGGFICANGVNAQITSCSVTANNVGQASLAYAGDPGTPYYNWVTYGTGYTYTNLNAATAGNGATVSMGHNICINPASTGWSGAALCYIYFHVSMYVQNDDPNSWVLTAAHVDNFAGITMLLSMSRCD